MSSSSMKVIQNLYNAFFVDIFLHWGLVLISNPNYVKLYNKHQFETKTAEIELHFTLLSIQRLNVRITDLIFDKKFLIKIKLSLTLINKRREGVICGNTTPEDKQCLCFMLLRIMHCTKILSSDTGSQFDKWCNFLYFYNIPAWSKEVNLIDSFNW